MPIYGQVGLFSLAAFVLGMLLTWLILARPLRHRITDLEGQLARRPAREPEPALATMLAPMPVSEQADPPLEQAPYDTAEPDYQTSVFGRFSDVELDDDLRQERFTPSYGGTEDPEPVSRSFFDEPLRDEVGAPESGAEPRTEHDDAYFAYLEETRRPDDMSTVDSSVLEDYPDEAARRGELRLSDLDSDDQQPVLGAGQEPVVQIGAPGGEQNANPTEIFGAIEVDRQQDTTTDLHGELSGELAEPMPEAPHAAGVWQDEAVAEEEQAERTRSLFEPALQPTFADEFEETTYLPPITEPIKDDEEAWQFEAAAQVDSVPAGPFGPGSALPLPDGSAPSPEFLVKARTSSMVFHTTSSPFYDRLLPQVWFSTPEEAARAGFTSWERPEGSWGTT